MSSNEEEDEEDDWECDECGYSIDECICDEEEEEEVNTYARNGGSANADDNKD